VDQKHLSVCEYGHEFSQRSEAPVSGGRIPPRNVYARGAHGGCYYGHPIFLQQASLHKIKRFEFQADVGFFVAAPLTV
jgi:hypothetical protein